VRLTLLAVGRLRPAFREAADDYLRRLRRFATVTEAEVREVGKASTAEEGRRKEAARLRERTPEGAHLVALDRRGRAHGSEELARRIGTWQTLSRPVVVVVGGSDGLDPDLLDECHERWSLGPLTLPHELARVVAYEQLYRGFTILRGERYHK
jgi:23S rRNA (pseudouridine1915-N3)-methyltransferase